MGKIYMYCCAIIFVILLFLFLMISNRQEGFNNYANILQANSLKKMRQWDRNHSNLYLLDNAEPTQQIFDPIRPILAFPMELDPIYRNSSYRNSSCR